MSGVLRWEEPPRKGDAGTARWDSHAVAAELREHPGRWALVRLGPGSYGTCWHIRNGQQLTAFRPAGAFEAVSRSTHEGVATYARYVGETPP